MGWNWVCHLSRYCRLTVITEQGFRESIERGMAGWEPEQRPQFRYVDISDRARERCWRQGDWRFYHDYRDWQLRALTVAQQLAQTVSFDAVHQLNMIGYREPGYLWKLGLPFIWGPVGGHVQMPWRFLPSLGLKSAAYHGCRNLINALQMRCSLRVACAARAASIVVCATAADMRALQRIHGVRPILIGETATSPATAARVHQYDGTRPLRLAWCGKVLGRKALPLALQALARIKAPAHLDVIGSGPDEKRARRLATALGIDSLVSWHGHTQHRQALEVIADADCLLFTSLQEATSTVVMEALSLGVAVLCHDTCGFGSVVDDSCGIKVPVRTPASSVTGFADAISSLCNTPKTVECLSRGALARAQQFTWDKKAREMVALYEIARDGRTIPEGA
jgi:glycosyltransferase involved in cell wall biosynthesis